MTCSHFSCSGFSTSCLPDSRTQNEITSTTGFMSVFVYMVEHILQVSINPGWAFLIPFTIVINANVFISCCLNRYLTILFLAFLLTGRSMLKSA